MATNHEHLLHTSKAKIDHMAGTVAGADMTIQAEIKAITLALATGNGKAIEAAIQKISAASTAAASGAKVVMNEVKEYMAGVPKPAPPVAPPTTPPKPAAPPPEGVRSVQTPHHVPDDDHIPLHPKDKPHK